MNSIFEKWDTYVPFPLNSSSVCVWDAVIIIPVAFYVSILVGCIKMLDRHRKSLISGEINGLTWYLACTTILCAFRGLGFVLVPFLHNQCNFTYSFGQWDFGGNIVEGYNLRIKLVLLIVSSSSSGLFFTSYTYLAYSLAKVLELLTSSQSSHQSNSGRSFFLVLVGQNVCVWFSVFVLWFTSITQSRWAPLVDNTARFLVSVAAFSTGVVFSTHVFRASMFLRSVQDESVRATQLERLLKLRRVNWVCRVCTFCFMVKGTLLAYRNSVSPVFVVAYFCCIEIAPTAYMLHVFNSTETQHESLPSSLASENPLLQKAGPSPYSPGTNVKSSLNANVRHSNEIWSHRRNNDDIEGDFDLQAHETTCLLNTREYASSACRL